MKYTRARWIQNAIPWLALLIAIAGSCVSAPQASAQPAEDAPIFQVIGHSTLPDTLTHDEIKQIFLGRMTRKNGQAVVFVIFHEETVYAAFLQAYVGKSVSQYTNYWKKQVFTGKGRMPKAFEEPEDVLTYVAEHDGAISFLPADTPLTPETIHAITVVEE